MTPEQLIRPEILAMNAYHVPPATGMLKLDAMENPYPLPPALRQELGQGLGEVAMNRYPDPTCSALKASLRATMAIPADMDIMLGNGSDELIQILTMAVARPGAVVLSVEPSFVMYKLISVFCGARYVGVPLKADFSLDLDATLAAVRQEQPALIYLAYPNNPTGNHFDRAAVEAIIRASSGLVVLDEAYQAFARDSFMSRLGEFPNLLVMRTLSKLGLAGLRLGFLVGRPEWMQEFDKVRLPYNINVLSQFAAEKVLANVAELNRQTAEIRAERAIMAAALSQLDLETFPSDTNFILIRLSRAAEVFAKLKAANILVKNLDGGNPMLKNCLRLTIGTPAENSVLLNALKSALITQ